MAVMNLTKENFEREVAEGTVLVDFWAPWCMPCRMLSPVVDAVGEEVTNTKVAKVNVDEQESLAVQFGVMTIPTLIVLKNGKEVKRSVGVISKDAILNMLG
ncbi:MAG: thioredoxin [Lachnospiraceae bacterium]|nr:thioredoxin [Lachnospiraceae bacterium]